MKLSPGRFGCAVSTVWSLCVFGAGLLNLATQTYGAEFLKLLSTIYPGYTYGKWGFGGIIVVTLYAALDAWIMGALLAWFYNFYAKKSSKES
jgi:hypothetical protein